MADSESILRECKTLSQRELDEVLLFIGFLKFRAATSEDGDDQPSVDRSDA